MKTVKTLLKIVGGLILLVAVALLAVVALFDPNDYKPEMVAAVKQASGREVHIDGRIEWSLFPYLGVSAGPLAMDNAQGKGAFARIRRAGFKIAVWPLVHKKVVIDRVFLDGLELNLVAGAKGNNWEDLLPQRAQTPPDESAAPIPDALNIGAISVSDGSVSYRDTQKVRSYQIRNIHLDTAAISFEHPFDIRAGFALAGDSASRLDFDARARINLDPRGGHFALQGLKLAIQGQWQRSAIDFDAGAGVRFDRSKGTFDLSDLVLRLHNMRLAGKLTLKQQHKGWNGEGALEVADFSPRELLEKLTGQAVGGADPKALAHASARLKADITGSKIQLTLAALKLDDTTFSGNLKLVQKAVPEITFKLSGDQLDLDRYLAKRAASTPEPRTRGRRESVPKANASAPTSPAVMDLKGDFDFGRFKAAGLTTENIHMHVAAHGGRFDINPIQGDFYDGKIHAGMRLDTGKAALPVHFKGSISGVQAEALSRDLLGSPRVLGRADAALDLRAAPGTALAASLNGNLELNITDGAVKGFDLMQQLRAANARLSGKPVPQPTQEEPQTEFTELDLRVDVSHGIAKLSTLDLHSPVFKLTGSGEVDLPAQSVNLLLKPQLIAPPVPPAADATAAKPTPADQGMFDKLRGVPIPIRVSGALTHPSYGVDLAAAISATLQGNAENALGNALNNLFGKKKKKKKRRRSGG